MKTEKIEALLVTAADLQAFAIEKLGLTGFSVIENEFIAHDCELMFKVDGKMEGYDFREVNKLIAEKTVPEMGLDMVLDLLCRENLITEGLYLITVRI